MGWEGMLDPHNQMDGRCLSKYYYRTINAATQIDKVTRTKGTNVLQPQTYSLKWWPEI